MEQKTAWIQRTVSEYDQEIPQSQTADKPMTRSLRNSIYTVY